MGQDGGRGCLSQPCVPWEGGVTQSTPSCAGACGDTPPPHPPGRRAPKTGDVHLGLGVSAPTPALPAAPHRGAVKGAGRRGATGQGAGHPPLGVPGGGPRPGRGGSGVGRGCAVGTGDGAVWFSPGDGAMGWRVTGLGFEGVQIRWKPRRLIPKLIPKFPGWGHGGSRMGLVRPPCRPAALAGAAGGESRPESEPRKTRTPTTPRPAPRSCPPRAPSAPLPVPSWPRALQGVPRWDPVPLSGVPLERAGGWGRRRRRRVGNQPPSPKPMRGCAGVAGGLRWAETPARLPARAWGPSPRGAGGDGAAVGGGWGGAGGGRGFGDRRAGDGVSEGTAGPACSRRRSVSGLGAGAAGGFGAMVAWVWRGSRRRRGPRGGCGSRGGWRPARGAGDAACPSRQRCGTSAGAFRGPFPTLSRG